MKELIYFVFVLFCCLICPFSVIFKHLFWFVQILCLNLNKYECNFAQTADKA